MLLKEKRHLFLKRNQEGFFPRIMVHLKGWFASLEFACCNYYIKGKRF